MQATIAVEARLASNKSGTSNVAALKAMYGEFFTVDTSNRVPLPFSGAFSCFRFRAFLLFLLLPCASAVLMAVVLVSWASGWLETADVLGGLDADADNEAMGIEWAILDVPSSFAIQLLLALAGSAADRRRYTTGHDYNMRPAGIQGLDNGGVLVALYNSVRPQQQQQ